MKNNVYALFQEILGHENRKPTEGYIHSLGLCQKAGVRYFRFHPIRHAGATLMENINIPIVHIQEILGHENRKTTEAYTIEKYEDARNNTSALKK